MTEISAYLRFDGNCREAMTFYKECLGGELTMQSVGEMPGAGEIPEEQSRRIIHATLRKGGMVLMGSDMGADGERVQGNTTALTLNCSSADEIKSFFESLSEGGKATHPLKVEFWGGTFGVLVDKYGVEWLLNYEEQGAA